MGFGGATAAMATILKNNNRRGKRKGLDGFSITHKEQGRISKKPISKEALAKIRKKLKAEQSNLLVKRTIAFFLVVIAMILCAVLIF